MTDENPNTGQGTGDDTDQQGATTGTAPEVSGDDVRVGPEDSDQPQAGAAEPTD